MSPVNAKVEEHYINGKVRDVFEFEEPKDVNDHSGSFIDSGLFVWWKYDFEVYHDNTGQYSTWYHWFFTAVKPGFKVIKKDHWDWSSADYYYFDIEV
jgi:hypothetical protein